MDPQATLDNIRAIVAQLRELIDNDEDDVDPTAAAEFVATEGSELIDAWIGLDEWMTKGGFLPTDWRTNR